MYNDILSIGPFVVHGYGLMIAIGIIAALFVGLKLAKAKGLNTDEVYNLLFIAVLCGFAVAKVLYCIVEIETFLEDPLSTLGSGGFVVYGGIIGGTFFCWLYTRIKKLSFYDYFDIVLPSVAVAQAFGRIGCFLAGCCYGRETDSFIGITFHNSDFAPNGVSLIPTQLISSAALFVMAVMLILHVLKSSHSGSTGALYLIIYSIGRSIIEIFRDDYRGSIGFLSTSQFISIFILLLGIFIYVLSVKGKFDIVNEDEI